MDGLRSFFAMGGYGAFIWPAYGVALAVLGALTLAAMRRLRRSQADLAELESGRPQRQPTGSEISLESRP